MSGPKMTINSLLKFTREEMSKVKVKFTNINRDGENPLDEYRKNPDRVNTRWFLWYGKKRYYRVGTIAINLLDLGDNEWLLTSIKRITKLLDVVNDTGYEAVELEDFKQYYGKLKLHYDREFRAVCVKYETVCDKLVVDEVLEDPLY